MFVMLMFVSKSWARVNSSASWFSVPSIKITSALSIATLDAPRKETDTSAFFPQGFPQGDTKRSAVRSKRNGVVEAITNEADRFPTELTRCARIFTLRDGNCPLKLPDDTKTAHVPNPIRTWAHGQVIYPSFLPKCVNNLQPLTSQAVG